MVVHVAVHVVHGIESLLVGVEDHKAVAFTLAGFLILYHINAQDTPAAAEQRIQVGLVRLADTVDVDDVSAGGADSAGVGLAADVDVRVAEIKEIVSVGAGAYTRKEFNF